MPRDRLREVVDSAKARLTGDPTDDRRVCVDVISRLEALFRDQARGWYFSMPEDKREQHGRQRVFLTDEDRAELTVQRENLEQHAIRRENGRELVAFLEDTLTPRQLFAVVRYYWLGDPDHVIGERLGISQPMAHKHRRRALDAITAALTVEKNGEPQQEVITRAVSSTLYWEGWAYEPTPPSEARPSLKTERRATFPMDLARRTYRCGSGGYSTRGIWRVKHTNKLPDYVAKTWPSQGVQLPLDMMPDGPERAFLAAAVARDQQGKQPRTVLTVREYLAQPTDVLKPGDRSRFISGPLIKRQVSVSRYLHLTALERENVSPTLWREATPKRSKRLVRSMGSSFYRFR